MQRYLVSASCIDGFRSQESPEGWIIHMVVKESTQTHRSGNKEKHRNYPFISVIVPVRNEAEQIGTTLSQLVNQEYPSDSYEIIVADGRSTDDTRDRVMQLASRHRIIRLIDNPRRWSSAGRNAAIRAARGDYVLLIDGHCEIRNRNYLSDLADDFMATGADCIGRPQSLEVTGASRIQQAIAVARSCWLGHHPASHIYSHQSGFVPPESVAVAYRRSIFTGVGLFDERFDACEDYEFNHRIAKAGMRCYFSARLEVHYHPRRSLSGLYHQMIRYGRGRVRLLRKHPETFSLASLAPAGFLMGLILGPIMAIFWTILWIPYVIAIVIYLIIVLAVSIQLSIHNCSFELMLLLPQVFATLHAGAGVGVLWELIIGKSVDVETPIPANIFSRKKPISEQSKEL